MTQQTNFLPLILPIFTVYLHRNHVTLPYKVKGERSPHSLANRHSCSTWADTHDRKYFSMQLILVVGKMDMINHICQMLSRNVGILRKLKFTLPQTCLLLLYNSLVLLYLDYFSIIWGCSSPNKLKSLIVLQNRTVRIIAKTEFRAHTTSLFKKYSLLKIWTFVSFK